MLTDQEIQRSLNRKWYNENKDYYRKYHLEVRKGLTPLQQAEKEYEQIKEDVRRKNMRLSEL